MHVSVFRQNQVVISPINKDQHISSVVKPLLNHNVPMQVLDKTTVISPIINKAKDQPISSNNESANVWLGTLVCVNGAQIKGFLKVNRLILHLAPR